MEGAWFYYKVIKCVTSQKHVVAQTVKGVVLKANPCELQDGYSLSQLKTGDCC